MIFNKISNYGIYADSLISYYGKYCGVYNSIEFWDDLNIRRNEFTLICPSIPEYASIIYGEGIKLDFHLGGFSESKTNAFLRSHGEAVERYSYLLSETKLKRIIIRSSYNNLKKEGKKVCPLEYVNVFSQKQLNDIRIMNFVKKPLDNTDEIDWVCCKSIYNDEPVYIPAQLFFLISSDSTEQRYFTSVSTGTAAHKTIKQAITNALIEYVQVDSFMLCWHVLGKMKKIQLISPLVQKVIQRVEYMEEYSIEFFDMTEDKPIFVIGCILRRKDKKYPYCSFGMQADEKIEKAFYRSFMEAYVNIVIRRSSKEEEEKQFFVEAACKSKERTIYNLSDNVNFYLSEWGIDTVDTWLNQIIITEHADVKVEKEKKVEIYDRLIEYLSTLSEYACYLDITSEEFLADNWHVARCVIPELLPLCMPSIPYEKHPRVKKYGGIRNQCIHPSP